MTKGAIPTAAPILTKQTVMKFVMKETFLVAICFEGQMPIIVEQFDDEEYAKQYASLMTKAKGRNYSVFKQVLLTGKQ